MEKTWPDRSGAGIITSEPSFGNDDHIPPFTVLKRVRCSPRIHFRRQRRRANVLSDCRSGLQCTRLDCAEGRRKMELRQIRHACRQLRIMPGSVHAVAGRSSHSAYRFGLRALPCIRARERVPLSCRHGVQPDQCQTQRCNTSVDVLPSRGHGSDGTLDRAVRGTPIRQAACRHSHGPGSVLHHESSPGERWKGECI